MVAAAGRYAEGHRVQKAGRAGTEKYEKLQETIEYLKTWQYGLMTTTECKNRTIKRVSEEIQNRFLKDVLGLKEKLKSVEDRQSVCCTTRRRKCRSGEIGHSTACEFVIAFFPLFFLLCCARVLSL